MSNIQDLTKQICDKYFGKYEENYCKISEGRLALKIKKQDKYYNIDLELWILGAPRTFTIKTMKQIRIDTTHTYINTWIKLPPANEVTQLEIATSIKAPFKLSIWVNEEQATLNITIYPLYI